MEPSHRDQMESSAAVGFPPAYTHTLWHFTVTPLYLFTLTVSWHRNRSSFLRYSVYRGDSEHRKTSTVYPLPVFCIFPLSQLYPLLCFHAVRPICGLCIEETEFNLTVLEGYVHPAIHPEPSQCINPWTQPGAVSLGCRLFLVLEVCSPQTRPGIARVK